ncbi:MAG: MOSC domain-containing protein [Deltaproteobacteria bacterium]|nr:MOSC domain-containing protein [Deltaproteobacteria bacterium]
MARTGRLDSIQLSDGGVPKRPVAEAAVGAGGLAGDRQRDLRYHGGPLRAVCLFSAEVITALRAEGHPILPGGTGENLTVSGLPWGEVVPGAELAVGPVLLRVESYAAPCQNISGSFAGRASARISQKLHPGWSRVYASVVAPGAVRVGDAVVLRPPAPAGR